MSNKLPRPYLPEAAAPWARQIEAELAEKNSLIANLKNEIDAANTFKGVQNQQLTTLQNYIRTICEIQGLDYPPVALPPAPPPPPPGVPDAPVFKIIDIPADWSSTWYQGYKRTSPGGTNDDSQSLYQRGSGYTYSMWHFALGEALGKNIVAANMYLSNISTYYNGQFTAILGTHGYTGSPGTRPAGGRINGFDVGWSAGEAKWISIPPSFFGALSNGSIQGFTMGDLTRETQNYARFNGVGRGGAPVLRVQFQV